LPQALVQRMVTVGAVADLSFWLARVRLGPLRLVKSMILIHASWRNSSALNDFKALMR